MNTDTQDINLSRVHSKIGPVILEFCLARMGQQFHMTELTAFVQARIAASPDSPSRILREMRLQGVLDYRVVNRRQSLYLLIPVTPADDIEAALEAEGA